MKSKLLVLFLLSASSMMAAGRVFIGGGFRGFYGGPGVVVAPYAAPYVAPYGVYGYPAYPYPYAYPYAYGPAYYGGIGIGLGFGGYGYRGGYAYRGGYGYGGARGYVGGGVHGAVGAARGGRR